MYILISVEKHGIPSALQHDNVKSETSQRAQQIHQELVIADQCTEPHSLWENSTFENGF